MVNVKRRSIVLKALLFSVVLLGGSGWFTSRLWFPGITPTQTAEILIRDRKFGMRALGMAHFWSDCILEPLREVSKDFRLLDDRNSFWVAEVLSQNKSLRSEELAHELYERNILITKLVGAVGLAAHGKLTKKEFQDSGPLHGILTDDAYLYRYDSQGRRSYTDTAPLELTLVAAKTAKSGDSVQSIMALIKKRPLPYEVHANAADALGAIGDHRAVSVLVEAMRSRNFYALPEAFRALVTLSDDRAIPLAIDRILPEIQHKNSGFIVRELERVTGKNFGFDQARWREWWASQAKPTEPL